MKRIKLAHLRPVVLAVVGVFLGRGAQADTTLDFDSRQPGQNSNAQIQQSFGDNAYISTNGVTVAGPGTPNIGLTWQSTGGRWDYYTDSVWTAAQLESSAVGDLHEVVFTPSAGSGVVVKSLNFHPYYASAERYTYAVSVMSGATVLKSVTNTFVADATKNHPANLNYTGALGQSLTLRLTRLASTLGAGEIEGSTQNIAVDDIVFDQYPTPSGPIVTSVSPGSGQVGVIPEPAFKASVKDGTTAMADGSVQLRLNGSLVSPSPSVSRNGDTSTVLFQGTGVLPSASTNVFRLTYSDNGVPARSYTNDATFVVAAYVNKQLPAPLYFEDFDSTPEGSLPAGWSAVAYCDRPPYDPAIVFTNLGSAAYTNWTVVEASLFTGTFETYDNVGTTPAGEASDYQRVLSVNPANVVNGTFVRNLASGRMAFGNSGYRLRSTPGEVTHLFTPDYNLSGKANVFLAFNSLWEQNQNSLAAVEYSLDLGQTWLPVIYMLERADVLTDANGAVDAAATFSRTYTDVATYVDPVTAEPEGGHYGAFIGVDSNRWASLSSSISPRADDNATESKRVELFRLPLADNQPTVRFRITHSGHDSWYFGLDNFGLYQNVVVPPPVVGAPASQTNQVGSTVVLSAPADGIWPLTYQWQFNGVNLPASRAVTTNAVLVLTNLQLSDAGSYSVVVGNSGGSTAGASGALGVINPLAPVTGQWDFATSNLTATCGQDLAFFDPTVESATLFARTTDLFIPDIAGTPTVVMQVSPVIPFGGYVMRHGIPANGGGVNVNQYTLILDVLYPSYANATWRALLQASPTNADDAEFFVNNANGVGIDSVYQGDVTPDVWHRIALAVDLSGPGPSPTVAKFIDGIKVGQQTLAQGRDGRWSLAPSSHPLTPWALLLADNDGDNNYAFVSSVQIRGGRLSDAAIAALGAPTAGKIPGAICISAQGSSLSLRWSGNVLQSAEAVAGPWTTISGASKPYQVPTPLGARKFFRAQ
jgi:hypothetical protein